MSTSHKLAFGPTVIEAVTIGATNAIPIMVNVLLWGLTIWIPYLNVGTTIGLFTGVIAKASKGEPIPVIEIFDPSYRKYIGEFFVTFGLMQVGILAGLTFFIVPGIVIYLAWCFAPLLLVDKHMNPAEAISVSNDCTYGYKWAMFGITLAVEFAFFIVGGSAGGVLIYIVRKSFSLQLLVLLLLVAVFGFLMVGLKASFYRRLTDGH
ncbi:MAG: hypothetical protein FWG02_07865 [Holophagaceae bacterium]|nr:hypothetical protein [Holophagaceae bacterium]